MFSMSTFTILSKHRWLLALFEGLWRAGKVQLNSVGDEDADGGFCTNKLVGHWDGPCGAKRTVCCSPSASQGH